MDFAKAQPILHAGNGIQAGGVLGMGVDRAVIEQSPFKVKMDGWV